MTIPRKTTEVVLALTILEGCPSGATEDALKIHAFGKPILQVLAMLGFADMRIEDHAKPFNLKVRRWCITESGREFIGRRR